LRGGDQKLERSVENSDITSRSKGLGESYLERQKGVVAMRKKEKGHGDGKRPRRKFKDTSSNGVSI